MHGRPTRCGICGKFLDSKKALKEHKDDEHRITNDKIRKLRIPEGHTDKKSLQPLARAG